MALKGKRFEGITDISFFMDAVAERGGVAVVKTVGSGEAMDQDAAEVEYADAPSGKVPMGILLNEMVNKDLTRQKLNEHQDEVQKGGKVTLLMDGWVTTDMILSGDSPNNGQKAYVGASGYLTVTGGTNPEVGRFMSQKDEDGYAKVYVKLPK